ncbi:pleckstrin homology domain-containing family J member 1 isoform X2 [Gavia stellata]|uniref:pleckstrin homology domain-containing family J member 1 isoform X2 n=1 Tax=Gavia stellata TaxID=37040 RepID=UPI00289F2C6D|nr:pleckstrin homology domain-containing family J member 1 isoform X2 [Gavia stellata]
MRYNERELLSLARQPAEKAAEILMRVPKKGSVLKKRLVKLVVNFLFYFRTDEAEVEALRTRRASFAVSFAATQCCSPFFFSGGYFPLELCSWSNAGSSKRRKTSSQSVSLRSQRGNTALNVTVKSSVRSGLRHSSEPAMSS